MERNGTESATDPTKILSPERVSQGIMKVAAGEGGIRSGQTLEITVGA